MSPVLMLINDDESDHPPATDWDILAGPKPTSATKCKGADYPLPPPFPKRPTPLPEHISPYSI